MDDLIVALGLVLVIEGVLYAVAPNGMKRLIAFALQQPSSQIRVVGLVMAALGVLIVAIVRG